MARLDKLKARLAELPADFTWDEARALLVKLGFTERQGSGSRVRFINERTGHKILLHKPHPGNELKGYQVRELYSYLEQQGYL